MEEIINMGLCSVILIIICIIIYILYSNKTNKERFITTIYTPSYFERNEITINISQEENESDKYVGHYLKSKLPFNIRYDKYSKSDTNLILLPESNALPLSTHKLVIPIHYLGFSLLCKVDNTMINNFVDMNDKRIAIYPKGGYTETIYKYLIKKLNFSKSPDIIDYKSKEDLFNKLDNGDIDCIGILLKHPNEFVKEMTYKFKIKIINWEPNERLIYYFPNLQKVNMDFSEYRLFDIKKTGYGYGVKLSLFAHKDMSIESINIIIKTYGERNGKTKNWIMNVSQYGELHEGALKYYRDNGFFLNRENYNPACKLLAGKEICNEGSDLEKTANIFYSRDYPFEDNKEVIIENQVVKFLKETAKNKDIVEQLEKKLNKQIKFKTDDNVDGRRIKDNLQSSLNLSYQCYGNTKIRNKENCIKSGGIWDKPCISNNECPFYKSNKNYENNRGGCMNGFCEMPINVKRLGFQQYDKNSNPICHGCKLMNEKCCIVKNGMFSPDYVFDNDKQNRISKRDELNERNIEF